MQGCQLICMFTPVDATVLIKSLQSRCLEKEALRRLNYFFLKFLAAQAKNLGKSL